MPAVPTYVYAIIDDGYAFGAQAHALFVPGGGAGWQAEPATGTDYPVPR